MHRLTLQSFALLSISTPLPYFIPKAYFIVDYSFSGFSSKTAISNDMLHDLFSKGNLFFFISARNANSHA